MVGGKIVYRDFRADALQIYSLGRYARPDPARADELLRQALTESHLISDASLQHHKVLDLADTIARSARSPPRPRKARMRFARRVHRYHGPLGAVA